MSFYRKVRYYFYLKIQLFLDNYSSKNKSEIAIYNKTDLKKWKNNLSGSSQIIKCFNIENDQNTIMKANKILEHRFYLLGHNYFIIQFQEKPKTTYESINWHFDPSTGKDFPQNIWYRLIRKKIPVGADLKYPWELSRFNHLILLGRAYSESKDEKYALEFVNQILDWIQNNPVRYGINWANTMEVGIRVANWGIGFLFFQDSKHISDEFLLKFFRSCQQHGSHIFLNLENLQPKTSNHYIGNIFGLFILSTVFPFFKQSEKWENFSRNQLELEIFNQTDKDGWSYEASTSYHKLITEMFLYSSVLAENSSNSFTIDYKVHLSKMIEILSIIQKPDNTIPQIGDNDSGFSFKFNFEDSNLKTASLLSLAKKYNLNYSKTKLEVFKQYEDMGYFIYKNKELYFLITAGPKNFLGRGSHVHNDTLHYILNIKGSDVLIDPGSFVYNSNFEKRNKFRSITSHNTLSWENLEPRNLENGLFYLKEEGSFDTNKFFKKEGTVTFSGKYSFKNYYHKRVINSVAKEKKIIVVDTCSTVGASLSFNFAPNIIPQIKSNVIKTDYADFIFSGISVLEVKKSQFSSGYGTAQENYRVKATLSGKKSEHKIIWK